MSNTMRDALKVYQNQNKALIEKPELQYQEDVVLALDTAQTDYEVDRGGISLAIVNASGQVYIRLNEKTNPLIDFNKAFTITAPFYRFFLTWTAQAGLVATVLISSEMLSKSGVIPVSNTISGLPGTLQQVGTTPTPYNMSIVANDTEYSQVLPTGTKFFEMHIQDDSCAYRVAYVTGKVVGKVAPYLSKLVGAYYYETCLLTPANLTLYFASSAGAGKVMEIIVWV